MKVKVCGLREPENIEAILALPVDMVGFILYPGSPRFAGLQAGLPEWVREHGARFREVRRVGVFVNAQIDEILNAVHDYALDYVQLHGEEPPEYLGELHDFWKISSARQARLIKAFGVDERFDPETTHAFAPFCDLFIFDTRTKAYGGSGRTFNWETLAGYTGTTPFLLSGGIGPDSVPDLRAWGHPQWAGVDINSRFETRPGHKDPAAVEAFVRALGSTPSPSEKHHDQH